MRHVSDEVGLRVAKAGIDRGHAVAALDPAPCEIICILMRPVAPWVVLALASGACTLGIGEISLLPAPQPEIADGHTASVDAADSSESDVNLTRDANEDAGPFHNTGTAIPDQLRVAFIQGSDKSMS